MIELGKWLRHLTLRALLSRFNIRHVFLLNRKPCLEPVGVTTSIGSLYSMGQVLVLAMIILVLPSLLFAQWSGAKPILGEPIDFSHPLARGLVACWLLNEGGGSKVYDLSGNGHTGTTTSPNLSASALGGAPPSFGTNCLSARRARVSAIDFDHSRIKQTNERQDFAFDGSERLHPQIELLDMPPVEPIIRWFHSWRSPCCRRPWQ